MTKEDFCKVYDLFSSLIKQEVSGRYCWNASCALGNDCNQYELVLIPSCMIWGEELSFLSALCERLVVSMAFFPSDGSIRIW